MPFQLRCLSCIYRRFNFKIPQIAFGIRFASITNPQTHLKRNVCGGGGVSCTAHRSDVQAVCLYKNKERCISQLKKGTCNPRFLPHPSRMLQESTQLPSRLKSRHAKHMSGPGPQQPSAVHFLSQVLFFKAENKHTISKRDLARIIIQFWN